MMTKEVAKISSGYIVPKRSPSEALRKTKTETQRMSQIESKARLAEARKCKAIIRRDDHRTESKTKTRMQRNKNKNKKEEACEWKDKDNKA